MAISSLVAVFPLVVMATASAQEIASGSSLVKLEVLETSLDVYCYKPADAAPTRMIMVMHGVNRNADAYRDNARAMGDRFQALIVAPCFDSERFPTRKYQYGGILNRDKSAAPEDQWTYQFIPAIAEKIREVEGQGDMPLWIIGHSAGGQFVVRMSAFINTGAVRLVAANPGSLLFPTREDPFGYGFGDLPEELATNERLQEYLAAPLTIYVGSGDNKPDRYFDQSAAAMKQGPGRYQRGKACFEFARQLAKEKEWPFHWQLVEAPDVIHDHQAMFDHEACRLALFGDTSDSSDLQSKQ